MNRIKEFINGDLTLWQSYWVVSVLISYPVGFICGFVGRLLSPDNPFIIYLGVVAWLIFVTIGTWRAADKYNGSNVWSTLAKIMLVVSWIVNFYILAEGL
jgi:uncharacterized membrane protein